MACFSNRTKAGCAKFIAIVSCVLLVMGIASACYGYFGTDTKATWKLGENTFPTPGALFGILAILAGAFTAITGLLGLLTAKFKKCCFTLPFMIFSAIICILMLVVSVIALAGQNTEEIKAELCFNKSGKNEKINGYEHLSAYSKSIYGPMINKVMCTPTCPCLKTA